MLAGMLLDVIEAAILIDMPVHCGVHRNRFDDVMKNASLFVIGDYGNLNLARIDKNFSCVVDLPTAGGIKGGAVEDNNGLAGNRKRVDNMSIEVVEEGVVVIKAVSWHYLESRAKVATSR